MTTRARRAAHRAWLAGVCMCAVVASGVAHAEDAPSSRDTGRGTSTGGATNPVRADAQKSGPARVSPAADPRARAALEQGLAWLARAQHDDGSLTGVGVRRVGTQLDGGVMTGFAPVATTALASLAWMSGGSPPERGVHGHACARAIDWLSSRAETDVRSPNHGYLASAADGLSRMHGHAFATTALAQAFVDSPRGARGARVRDTLKAAVACIERSQGLEGGWFYEPKRSASHETSITVGAVVALRAARDAGIDVETTTISRALDYVARARKDDGSFRYALGDPRSSVAMTSAAIMILNATGTYDGGQLAEARDWIARKLAARSHGTVADDFILCPFYERLHVAQALWQDADLRGFEAYWRTELPRVLTSQSADGAWHDERFGDAYATASNCLFLALPQGLLPMFQR